MYAIFMAVFWYYFFTHFQWYLHIAKFKYWTTNNFLKIEQLLNQQNHEHICKNNL